MRLDPTLPVMLQARASDEYRAPVPGPCEREAIARAKQSGRVSAARLGLAPEAHALSRCGTAASLRAIDAAAGGGFYDVPAEAEVDADAADEALGGNELIVDVQTHYVGRGRAARPGTTAVLEFIRSVAPERFRSLDRETSLGFAEYLRCVYLESETAVATLTAAPGPSEHNILPNDEIAATRALLEQLGAGPRMLHHAIVHPNEASELERLADVVDRFRPCGLKVYTLYGAGGGRGWMLDDDGVGRPFLERARELGVRRVCAHKGLSALAPTGSPADVGPAARDFPELDLLVYHSGYEVPAGADDEEGPLSPEPPARGSDRLCLSLAHAGVGPGRNVYAELGSTWYLLARRPREAAHVLGKLLLAVGEENVLWGTDSVWYGPAQPLIDAFRAFQIPERLQEAHGYPALTPERKARILGLNAARVYGIDPAEARRAASDDDLAWVARALAHERGRGGLGA